MHKTAPQEIIDIVFRTYPRLLEKTDHYEVTKNGKYHSLRLWIKGEELARYIILEKCEIYGRYYITHGFCDLD
ncbi:hypothetical protein MMK73_000522 [Providencia rettgeri]|uniref:hypothetical protein n=1 Tax=Providencia sp. TaxID=589 RepID=UPI0024AB3696|nr:hypothetical protein [Providencia rettgeri]